MNESQAQSALSRLTVRAIQPGLQRSGILLEELERPDLGFPTIHITGTNGKGSVAAFLSAALVRAGYCVGRFTSPHLSHEQERMVVNGKPVTERAFSAAVSRLVPALRKLRQQGDPATTFEAWSVLAADLFRAKKVDLAIVEVGMGGRLDATTAWNKRFLTILTNIALEHTAYLGKTKLSILREKLGIAQRGVPLVSGEADPALRKFMQQWCRNHKVPLYFSGKGKQDAVQIKAWRPKGIGGQLLVKTRKGKLDLRVGLSGAFQASNAALAVLALEQLSELGFPVSAITLREGFRTVQWPGRLETVSHRPQVILDGAHNVAAVSAATEQWQKAKRKIDLVVGIMADKDVREMVKALSRISRQVWTITAPDPRGVPAQELATLFKKQGIDAQSCKTIRSALQQALAVAGPKGTVLVTGSLYNVEPARKALKF